MRKVVGAGDCDPNFTSADWMASGQLCTIEWTKIEAALDAGSYVIVVSHDDIDGKRNTYLHSKITVKEDQHDSVSLSSPPTPAVEYYTKPEIDAFIGAPTNPFDQSLNSTDSVTFSSIQVNSSIQANSAVMKSADLVSSATIAWDSAAISQTKLTLAHDAVLTLSNIADGQTISLSGTMGGAGGHSLALAHTNLTIREMVGNFHDIATLAIGDLFEVSIKRESTNLRVWISTLSLA